MLSEKILVLEDDEVLRTLIVDTLLDEGYAVVDASTPEQAVALAEGGAFHLFVTDVRMAGFTDGLGVLQILKDKHPRLRSLVITGYTDLKSPALAMRLRADDYLFKGDRGFGMQRLLDAVRTVLDRRPPEHSHSLLGRVLASSGGLLKIPLRALLAAKLPHLETARGTFFKVFYIGICSTHFTSEQGERYWQRLLELESQYLQRCELTNLSPLIEAYGQLTEALIEATAEPAPAKGDIPFRHIYQLVRDKSLSREALMSLPRLEIEPASRESSAYNFALYQSVSRAVHGVPEHEVPGRASSPKALLGLNVGPFQMVKFLGNDGDRWKFRGRCPAGCHRLVEVVPARQFAVEVLLGSMPSDSPLNDVEHAESSIEIGPEGTSLEGRGVLVRPWGDDCPDFSRLFQAGGHDLRTSLAYLRPIRIALQQAHQKGVADGFLQAERIICLDGALKIRSFGATGHIQSFLEFELSDAELERLPFSPWHVDLANLTESGPRPCNDQFTLAVLLCQLLSGETDPLALIWGGYGEEGELQPGWLEEIVGQPEAEAVLSRMLSLQVSRRYPDVSTGFEEICKIASGTHLPTA